MTVGFRMRCLVAVTLCTSSQARSVMPVVSVPMLRRGVVLLLLVSFNALYRWRRVLQKQMHRLASERSER
jgi:hypothetical protein